MKTSVVAVLAALLLSVMPMIASAYELSVTVLLNGTSEPVADAVVFVEDTRQTAPVAAEIYQKDRAFHPQVLVIPVGSSVDFPNRDNTQHHVYSFSPAKPFNIELYADRPASPIVFDKPGIVELGCNIHDHMQGFVIVTDNAATGQTNAAGQVTLTLDPQGTDGDQNRLLLKVWHPRLVDNTRPALRELKGRQPAVVTLDLEPEPALNGPMDRLQQRFREL
ncbi:methylamine utilization protein [Marinobacter sp. F3R08]|uniref:methylamine utilization protein n=1 Tax=Marinobacter sp. F3R08 TaxID=2841559 RepID=UPI001C088AB3|nr:methylamine utilization protein [Marinobacter sp. F3R08]MBU2952868.1 methylamine utilization protein [Marinobacter sp. F3R08]